MLIKYFYMLFNFFHPHAFLRPRGTRGPCATKPTHYRVARGLQFCLMPMPPFLKPQPLVKFERSPNHVSLPWLSGKQNRKKKHTSPEAASHVNLTFCSCCVWGGLALATRTGLQLGFGCFGFSLVSQLVGSGWRLRQADKHRQGSKRKSAQQGLKVLGLGPLVFLNKPAAAVGVTSHRIRGCRRFSDRQS